MKALENRTTDSKREMDILDALQDIRARNARNERVGQSQATELLERLGMQEIEDEEDRRRRLEEEEDEKLVQEVFSKVAGPSGVDFTDDAEGSTPRTITIKRKADGMNPDLGSDVTKAPSANAKSLQPPLKKKKIVPNSLGIKLVKKIKA